MIREGSVSSLEGKRASSESPQGSSMLRKNVCKIKQGIKTLVLDISIKFLLKVY